MFPDQPDFRTVVQQYEELSTAWQQKADELHAALAATTAVEECDEFVLRMVGPTQIASLEFTEAAVKASPVQLRRSVLDAVARLSVASADAQAAKVADVLGEPALGRQMRESVPDDLRERAGDESDDLAAPSSTARAAVTPAERLDFEQVMEWAESTSETSTIVSDDLVEMMSDVEGWNPSHLGIDENQLMEDLHREVQALVDGARDLPRRLEQIVAEESSKYLTVEVNAAGRLLDLTFRPAFRSVTAKHLTEDFARLLAAASRSASQLVFAEIDGHVGDDDPTVRLLRRPGTGE